MAYIESISNEDVAALPVVQFDGPIVVVDTPQALEEACQYLSKQPILGFDTETRPSFTAGVTNKVALLQLFGGEKCFLIRLNRVQMSKALTDILHRADIIKVGAAVKNDIVGLSKLRHFTAGGFVDLQVYSSQISDLISSLIIYLCAFVGFFRFFIQKRIRTREKTAETVASSEAKEGGNAQ